MNIFFRLISYFLQRFLLSLLLLAFLVSCASTDKRTTADDSLQNEMASYKHAAWQVDAVAENDAINILLGEADMLIEKKAFNAATDKLERVLRIKPEYAPAWSRLSWLALQTNSPKRSVQMAKRSNSFAFSNPELQSLNASFIREANKKLNKQ
ncbi:hypothetical protein MNBD_GAMMA06-1998 [hydrothermal vent metagenome]|uniref:Tetratricopeptide repeat protein n=1 Tax=hydrothermal vent metagenome TaxID=652676 RepID=A0A3B0XB18_9ZZZZ